MPKTINVDYISKIEGHARLNIKIDKGKIKKAELILFEGARFFEGIVKGKKWDDVSHITSRICGICSVVHSLASIKAIESAFSIHASEQTKLLREALNIGGIIQSHVLHIYFLVLPDYYGYSSAIEMASKYREEIERGLRLKKIGNDIVNLIGGRDVHPIAAVPGGFTRFPKKEDIADLIKKLKLSLEDAKETMIFFSSLKYPKFEKYTEYFALHGGSYFYSDKEVSCMGRACFPIRNYEEHFKEYLVDGSTSEFATVEGKNYAVGALARIINNKNLLSRDSKIFVNQILHRRYSPYMNNLAQAIEIYEGIKRCIYVLENIEIKNEPLQKIIPKKSRGVGAIEAPRGILFHKYQFDNNGFCISANITTPTTQNLQNIEDNIKAFLPSLLNKGKDEIKLKIEELIRAYDPCISCATHFLEIKWE